MAESYELCLQYELRTDDITMICIFVDGVVLTKESDGADQVDQVVNSLGGIQSRSGEELNDSLVNSDSWPVRTRMTKEKQKQRALAKLKMSCRDDTVLSPKRILILKNCTLRKARRRRLVSQRRYMPL